MKGQLENYAKWKIPKQGSEPNHSMSNFMPCFVFLALVSAWTRWELSCVFVFRVLGFTLGEGPEGGCLRPRGPFFGSSGCLGFRVCIRFLDLKVRGFGFM